MFEVINILPTVSGFFFPIILVQKWSIWEYKNYQSLLKYLIVLYG